MFIISILSCLAQIPLGSSHLDMPRTTCCACRARCEERVDPCVFQHGGWRRSSSARMYDLLFSGFASISGTTSGKSEVDMSTPVHTVATPLNTCCVCHACCARRDEHVAPCRPTSATRHVTIFPYAKMHGLDSVLWRDVTSQVEFGLI